MAKRKTKNTIKIEFQKAAFLSALKQSLGIVTEAAKITGMDRTAHYQFMESDPEYKKSVETLQIDVIDFAESALFKLVKAGNPTAILFLLKCKAKARGYIDRLEVTGADGGPLSLTISDQYLPKFTKGDPK